MSFVRVFLNKCNRTRGCMCGGVFECESGYVGGLRFGRVGHVGGHIVNVLYRNVLHWVPPPCI